MLEAAPTYASSETPNWNDRRWNQDVYDYYGARPYWGLGGAEARSAAGRGRSGGKLLTLIKVHHPDLDR